VTAATAPPAPNDTELKPRPATARRRRPRLPLWATVALSVATIGPTLAMAGHGQGLIASVGKGVPLVFVIGLVGVGLVGYGFIRLTRHLNHAGSAYALVGSTVGPRAGFFSGFAMIGTDAEVDRAVQILGEAIVDAASGVVSDDEVAPYAGW
jgi:hypothetical protein